VRQPGLRNESKHDQQCRRMSQHEVPSRGLASYLCLIADFAVIHSRQHRTRPLCSTARRWKACNAVPAQRRAFTRA
jgi:hypothetical protein